MSEVAVRQAFGSPGGKTKLAPKIVGMMPAHRIYVEPFAGGAAVYFKKGVSEKEVLNDKDAEIAFAFRFLRDMTPQQYEWLKRQNWTASERQFNHLKAMEPKTDAERFYKFYYTRWASYSQGREHYNPPRTGSVRDISRLPKLQERLRRTTVHNTTALQLINKYDSPSTLFYLDPPYPNRAFVGQTFKTYTEADLKEMTDRLQHIRGQFILSLGTEHTKLLPQRWHIHRVKLRRLLASGNKEDDYQYEIIATNFNPQAKSMRKFAPIEREYRSEPLERRAKVFPLSGRSGRL